MSQTTVHPIAESGFSTSQLYDRIRPIYSKNLVSYLVIRHQTSLHESWSLEQGHDSLRLEFVNECYYFQFIYFINFPVGTNTIVRNKFTISSTPISMKLMSQKLCRYLLKVRSKKKGIFPDGMKGDQLMVCM